MWKTSFSWYIHWYHHKNAWLLLSSLWRLEESDFCQIQVPSISISTRMYLNIYIPIFGHFSRIFLIRSGHFLVMREDFSCDGYYLTISSINYALPLFVRGRTTNESLAFFLQVPFNCTKCHGSKKNWLGGIGLEKTIKQVGFKYTKWAIELLFIT